MAGEDCLTCSPDCGDCPRCGDMVCQPEISETCFTCEDDCGRCLGCGDGRCLGTENCASCAIDCGSCAVCPNMRCEMGAPFYEDCINCPADCGLCPLRSCGESLTCVFGCFDFGGGGGGIPGFDFTCLIDCFALTCADARSKLDMVINCALNAFTSGRCTMGGGLGCIRTECSGEITACITDRSC